MSCATREELSDLIELLAVPVGAVVAGVQRQTEHADPILLPRPEQRCGHRQVLMDPRQRNRLREGLDALGPGRLERRLTVRDAIGVAGEHPANLLVVQLREPRGAQ